MKHNPNDKMFINNKLVTSVQIGFENMEYYTIPVECIQSLQFEDLGQGKCEISCHIIDNGKISNGWGDTENSFAQRVSQYPDITDITFICEDKSKVDYTTVWYCGDEENPYYVDENNAYQNTTFHSYKEVEFSISKRNKIYTIEEVLSAGMDKEVIFEDEFEIKYSSDKGCLFQVGTGQQVYLTLDILNAKFTKVG